MNLKIQEIQLKRTNFWPVIYRIGTYDYNAAQVILKYFKSLCKTVSGTRSFSQELSILSFLE